MNRLKKVMLIVVLLFTNYAVIACEVCQKQQPDIFRGITHGAGPQSGWDYVAVWCTVIIVAISFFYAVKFTLHPGERERDHIKRSIFKVE